MADTQRVQFSYRQHAVVTNLTGAPVPSAIVAKGNDAYTKASEGFYFLNGAEALDISDWTIRDMGVKERKIADRIGHLALVDERTTEEQTELDELLDELEN